MERQLIIFAVALGALYLAPQLLIKLRVRSEVTVEETVGDGVLDADLTEIGDYFLRRDGNGRAVECTDLNARAVPLSRCGVGG